MSSMGAAEVTGDLLEHPYGDSLTSVRCMEFIKGLGLFIFGNILNSLPKYYEVMRSIS